MLEAKLRAVDAARRDEPQRLPLNRYYNHNWFAPVRAREFRFIVNGQLDSSGPAVRWLVAGDRRIEDQAAKIIPLPGGERREIEFAGNVAVYELQASGDGASWRTIASNLDHTGRSELDLPPVGEQEYAALEGRPALLARKHAIEAQLAALLAPPSVYAARPRREIDKSFLLDRGSVAKPLAEVTPGALSAVSQLLPDLADGSADDRTRRLALTDWITDPKNPLTARVIVNRVWYCHFGNGIVNTPSDFGVMGDRPSHPELLDWLAAEFAANGWSIKWLHRQILATQAYRQSSRQNERAAGIDGAKRLLWRMPLKRMDAEMIRDSILFVSGKLNLAARGGPGFLLQKKGDRGSYIYRALDNDGPEVWRRAVYRFVVRGGERIMLDSFDCPDPAVATPQRSVSNTAVQALTLFKNDFVVRQSGLLAERAKTVDSLYEILFQRQASAREHELASRFLAAQPLAAFARVLLNSNEFVYVP